MLKLISRHTGAAIVAVRLFIVEDHELVRLGMRTVLASKAGWEICGEASSGSEAVAKAQQLQPDIVILDLTMPGTNGLAVAAEIRQAVPAVRMVFYSMRPSESTEQQSMTVGADEFVCHSASARELIASVERAAQKAGFESPIRKPKLP